ncbi:ferredoxin--NADP reductase, partial [Burkholderia pseudomallei]
RHKRSYYPTVTLDTFERQGRLTELNESGKLFDDLGLPPLEPAVDRAMDSGGPRMLADLVEMLERRSFVEGTTQATGD